MAYWWERYTSNPDSNTSSPPDGAPENHFPDQVNNISRQAMAAIAEIGSKVLGIGDGTSAPQAATTVAGPFLKLVYDSLLPVNTIMAWDSKGGTLAFPVPSDPEFSAVTWVPCDGIGGVPNFENDAVVGAQFAAGPGQNFTGDVVAAGQTGLGGAQALSGSADGTRLTVDQIPPHAHPITDDGHTHDVPYDEASGGPSGSRVSEIPGVEQPGVDGAALNTTGISVDNAGGEGPGFTQAAEHGHTVSVDSVDDHAHLTGTPPGTAMELYIRTV